ncbi:MAG: hypothetical protein OXH15_04515 [Gammaproteobacteria bacterium]|nr:hypothetical protein [Gammaproteobacteria bacterium]
MNAWRAARLSARHGTATALVAVVGMATMQVLAASSVCYASSKGELARVARTVIAPARSRPASDARVGIVQTLFHARIWSQGDHAFGVAHDYRAHQIDTGAAGPQTNGHLHRLSPRYRFSGERWDLSVSPMVATSSNVGRHPGEIHRALIDWHGSVAYRARLATHITGHAGACRDDRFGRGRVTPLLGVTWDAGGALRGTVGWPDSAFEWDVHPRWQLRAAVNPIGGRWAVYDDALASRTAFRYAGWRMRFSLGFRAAAHLVAVGVGRDSRRSFRFRLDDDGEFSSDFDDATALGVEWRWLRR